MQEIIPEESRAVTDLGFSLKFTVQTPDDFSLIPLMLDGKTGYVIGLLAEIVRVIIYIENSFQSNNDWNFTGNVTVLLDFMK
ncbi:MAG TPA: hypothetical protein VKM55_00165 [Candidatus Lokiarchaeia archaeon]|nr:hypothetical protein [Candidatus Lokiarchaeia archaeon]